MKGRIKICDAGVLAVRSDFLHLTPTAPFAESWKMISGFDQI